MSVERAKLERFDTLVANLNKTLTDIREELVPWEPRSYTASGDCIRKFGGTIGAIDAGKVDGGRSDITLEFQDDFIEAGTQLKGFEQYTGTHHSGVIDDFIIDRIRIEVSNPDLWRVHNFYIGPVMLWVPTDWEKGLPAAPFVDGLDLSLSLPDHKRLASRGVLMRMMLRYLGTDLSVPVKATVTGRARAS
jgi:hypothetical protein